MQNDVFHVVVFFTGHVQGVGFRYQTLQIAKEFEVSGYVMNLVDGRVQMEAEGFEDEINAFISELEDRLDGYIRNTEVRSTRRASQFRGFDIRY